MKKIYGIIIALLCTFLSFNANAQSTMGIYLSSGADIYDYGLVVQDFVLNVKTTQKGVITNYSWPLYSVNIDHTSPTLSIGTITSTETPTSISNAFTVEVQTGGSSYVTVKNNSTKTYYVQLDVQFNYDYPAHSPSVVIAPGAVGTIPVTTAMNYRKTFYSTSNPPGYLQFTLYFSTSNF